MIIFEEEYVKYDEITKVTLVDINEVLLENNIELDLGDDSSNDWAGYAYFYCKYLDELSDEAIYSFVSIITWIMTGVAVELNPKHDSDWYYKNEKILTKCLQFHNNLVKDYDDVVYICEQLFKIIYAFYLNNHESYIKRSERLNCLLTYPDMELFEKVDGKSRSDKIKNLLDSYFKSE